LYWSALLPQFVPVDAQNQFGLMIGLGLLAALIELLVLGLYAVGADRLRAVLAKAGVVRAIDLVAGTILIVAGALLGLKTSLNRR
jgi:threonine/homoserine/homoserine lactone efflux protein